MNYTKKSFTVPLGSRAPHGCEHGFIDRRGFCVFCGASPEQIRAYFARKAAS